ncbi:ribosome biogenesis GTPase YlqF [Pseudoalteromonas luteoviolacea]|uniref:Ribosome biogenesis GTPase A n=1 Tax=Pseudoalteromonas luteoviolacea DSM 6061 TaxID=1365250 RepID=A0A166XPS6_9GAMM|nr:ribosome biogenesis GTPase YlqF [Pseudoalteromonas luteoviolacea]KZN40666.1 GTPase YlqF [Pseudoalteromonas luteoviolacea DSM 6061]KZN55218.1 GTPase YlqF [Pseudoalteromonas luteoviolacea CPMOR-2]MBE0387723.1 ribosome biogenesis GTPase A [Pseudoalteromonas luteoviolacea DSM 6061]TQF72493.1 ribosome biogenesis GTPase YlqF [Pseudoalteromonas luteoviolacea]
MAIQWFPGHMNKARNEIKEIMPQMDVIIEVLDARIPYSSENPMVTQLRGDKPVIKILNKADLADPEMTKAWMEYFEQEDGVKTLSFGHDKAAEVHRINTLCKKLAPHKVGQDKQLKAMIMGIPNVGKSTLINILAGRIVAKTGNEPAVTKAQQRIRLEDGIMLYDTPGMLWPKVENENSGYRLAATGAIRDTAINYEEVASYTAEYLLKAYPELLKSRYKIDELPECDWTFIEMAGRKRGCIRGGNQVDTHKMSEILINELRDAILGRVTMETPQMREDEEQMVAELRAAAEAKKAAREEEKRQRRARARKNRR